MKLVKLLANLGYGSRKEVSRMIANGWVCWDDGRALDVASDIDPEDAASYARIRVDDEVLDPPAGLLLMLNKPVGYTCSTKDVGRLIHELLPPRFRLRKPALSTVGRLDRETSGLLLLTDDGALLHRIISPRSALAKVYAVTLAEDMRGDEAALFASGSLLLTGEERPLLPAELEVLGPRQARLTLHEGRYHQVRRMFAAVGNHVTELQRVAVGGLTLEGLPVGQWRQLTDQDMARIFA